MTSKILGEMEDILGYNLQQKCRPKELKLAKINYFQVRSTENHILRKISFFYLKSTKMGTIKLEVLQGEWKTFSRTFCKKYVAQKNENCLIYSTRVQKTLFLEIFVFWLSCKIWLLTLCTFSLMKYLGEKKKKNNPKN